MLKFRGFIFDDYTISDDGVWSQICKFCSNEKLSERLNDHGGGVCGVKGCNCNDSETDVDIYYVDFPIDCKRLRKDLLAISSNQISSELYLDGLNSDSVNELSDNELVKEYKRIYGAEEILEYLLED